MSEEGTGGVERQRRHVSTSQSKSEKEPAPEKTTKSRSASTTQGQAPAYTEAAEHPRHVDRPAPSPSTSSPADETSEETSEEEAPRTSISIVAQPQLLPQPKAVADPPEPQRQLRHSIHHHSHHHRHRPSSQKTEREKLEPPVTKQTLSELDVSKIIHNPKLRHDINFDPELHFRPNLDGDKGRKKQERANEFWTALERQLNNFINPETRDIFMAECGPGRDWCLPELLKAVKEIIQTLVPVRDRVYLDEGLNVELILQQFYQGVADLEKLASWLSRVLRSHCAPMRDDWVEDMYRQLSRGNKEGDMEKLVLGMKSLLGVLEAMKLDVANHQIRCLRPVLIEDTVNFEQKFFVKKMRMASRVNAVNVNQAIVQDWYRQAERTWAGTESVRSTQSSFGEMAVFMNALARLILPSVSVSNVPNTFLFDEERIHKLRADFQDAVNLEICMRTYEELDRLSHLNGMAQANAEADAIASSNFNFNAPPSRPGSGVFSSAGSTCSSSTPSPRNSGGIFTQPPAPSATEVRSRNAMVHSSFVALVQTAPPSTSPREKWAALAPEMAVQIFRFTDAPRDFLPNIEKKLTAQLTDFADPTYMEVEEHHAARLVSEMAKRVKELKGVSGVNLFTAATSRSSPVGQRSSWSDARPAGRDDGGIEDIAMRLAHLGILHWRVWAPIAYVEENESEMDYEHTSS